MGADEPADAAPVRVTDPQIAALLGPDAEVVSSETDSGRLALVVKTGEGIRVLLIDMRSGRVISVIGGQ